MYTQHIALYSLTDTHLEAGGQLPVVEEAHVLQDERFGGRGDVSVPSGHPVLAAGGGSSTSRTTATTTAAASGAGGTTAVERLGPAGVYEGGDG